MAAPRAPAIKVGRGTCPQCHEPVTFKSSAGGLLRYTCDCCDTSGYAQPNGTGFKAWSKTIKHALDEGKTTTAATTPPKPAADRQAFNLSQL